MEAKQHLTRITKEQADMFVETDLAHPRVFKGDDGSYWIKSDELRAYTSQALQRAHEGGARRSAISSGLHGGAAMSGKIPELTYGDTEIGVITECYKSLKMLDRDAQNRALNWLHSRLEYDTTAGRAPVDGGAEHG